MSTQTTTEATMNRVVSRDGTEIAYWTSGHGPSLVLVHGTTADHTRWRPLLPYLEPSVTVHAMDRRGRGASGDGPNHTAEREFEDVAAVIDAVAASTGSPVDVLGHSFGAFAALGAAALTRNIRKLVLYEPPGSSTENDLPPGVVERLDALLAGGKREAVIETMLRDVVKMPEHEIGAVKAQPSWQARIAAAHTIAREFRAEASKAIDLERIGAITVPTLMVSGGDSPPFLKRDTDAIAAALPDARVVVIEGQQHVADLLVPEIFAGHVLTFLRQ